MLYVSSCRGLQCIWSFAHDFLPTVFKASLGFRTHVARLRDCLPLPPTPPTCSFSSAGLSEEDTSSVLDQALLRSEETPRDFRRAAALLSACACTVLFHFTHAVTGVMMVLHTPCCAPLSRVFADCGLAGGGDGGCVAWRVAEKAVGARSSIHFPF